LGLNGLRWPPSHVGVREKFQNVPRGPLSLGRGAGHDREKTQTNALPLGVFQKSSGEFNGHGKENEPHNSLLATVAMFAHHPDTVAKVDWLRPHTHVFRIQVPRANTLSGPQQNIRRPFLCVGA